jgi:hypothetical protein
MTSYFITFSSGKPEWLSHSKWFITAESRSDALHRASLMHDFVYNYEVNMVTVSKDGATDLKKSSQVGNLDTDHARKHLEQLDRIWQQKFNTLENC